MNSNSAGTGNGRPTRTIRRIVVLGGGTAGFLAALALRKHVQDVAVTVIRSTKMGVIGVGEGTIPSVVHFLHRFLGYDADVLYREVRAAPKLGIRYEWGPRPFFNYTFTGQVIGSHRSLAMPRGYYCRESFDFADLNSALMVHDRVCVRMPNGQAKFNPNLSYHLENRKFVAFLERQADMARIEKIDDIVERVVTDTEGVRELHLASGQVITADLFVDASGFRAELIGRALKEPTAEYSDALFCDRAVVGTWDRTDETYHAYTTAETMDAGWCWRIEHDERINRGYVFCSKFISDDQAIEEFGRKNPRARVGKVIPFPAGVRRRTWVRNVIAIGNAAGFVEPLEATAIGMICDASLRLVKALQASGNRAVPIQRDIFNRVTRKNWDIIRDFLALHYKFNTRLDTPFWRAARADVSLGDAQAYVDYYRAVGPDFSILDTELKRDFFTAEGYLVMLLGQQVPFERPVVISPEQQQAWNAYKSNLRAVAADGLTVPEFLDRVRAEATGAQFARQAAMARNVERRDARIGDGPKVGELNWH